MQDLHLRNTESLCQLMSSITRPRKYQPKPKVRAGRIRLSYLSGNKSRLSYVSKFENAGTIRVGSFPRPRGNLASPVQLLDQRAPSSSSSVKSNLLFTHHAGAMFSVVLRGMHAFFNRMNKQVVT